MGWLYRQEHPTYCCGAKLYKEERTVPYSTRIDLNAILGRKNNIHDLFVKDKIEHERIFTIRSSPTIHHQVFLGENVKPVNLNYRSVDLHKYGKYNGWHDLNQSYYQISDGEHRTKFYYSFPETEYNYSLIKKSFAQLDSWFHSNLTQVLILADFQLDDGVNFSVAMDRGFKILPYAVRNHNTGNYLHYFYRIKE